MTTYAEQTRIFETRKERDKKARLAKEARKKGGFLFSPETIGKDVSLHFTPAPAAGSGIDRST